ncbi:MAG TPA: NAD(P)/FAD-dependent oxidoreductase [Pyrinomonadaceae bacterium]|nr:NAD(P)/FAD-dependent oxidoreductase [Pyrinomonadaceae bacterium]
MASKARVLIIGGGFGGLFTALELAGHVDVTLLSEEDRFTFRPLLYEYLSGEVEEWHIAPPYHELIDERINFVQARATDLDLSARKCIATDPESLESAIEYDVLVIAVGGQTNYAGVPGAQENSLSFRGIDDADRLRQRMVDALDRIPPDLPPQDVRSAVTFAVVGGGASGVELSTKMADLLTDAFARRALKGEPRVLVIEMGDRVVPGMGADIREHVERALHLSRVEVHTLTRVVRVSEASVTIEHEDTQSEIAAAGIVWVGGVRVNPLIGNMQVEKTRNGLLKVTPTLQIPAHDNVFALGDIAHFEDADAPLAGTAQLAFQESALAARNVRALLAGEKLQTKHFEEIGEALSLGTERGAVLTGGKVFGGAMARQARFALYTSRLPTWQHRLRVGASWFFGGTTPRPLLPLGFQR